MKLQTKTVWSLSSKSSEEFKSLLAGGKFLELILVGVSNIACANIVEEFFLFLLTSQDTPEAKEEISQVYEVYAREYYGRWRYRDAQRGIYVLKFSSVADIPKPWPRLLQYELRRFRERKWSTVNMKSLEPIVHFE